MKRYEYKVYNIPYSIWTGKAHEDYVEVINRIGNDGWRFVCFSPTHMNPKGVKGTDLIFEKEMD